MKIWLRSIGGVVAAVAMLALTIDFTTPTLLSVKNVTPKVGAEASGVLFWVPANKDVLTMSAGKSDVDKCSPELTRWLKMHGSEVISPQDYLVTNDSARAATLRFGFDPQEADGSLKLGFYVQCGLLDITGPGDYKPMGARSWHTIDDHLDEGTANTFVDTANGGPVFVERLAPGEQAGLTIIFDDPRSTKGSPTISGAGSTSAPPIVLPVRVAGGDLTAIRWPGIAEWSSVLVHPLRSAFTGESSLYCKPPGSVSDIAGNQCDGKEILAMVKLYYGATGPPLSGLQLPTSRSPFSILATNE